jgi:spore coat protein U-like protein
MRKCLWGFGSLAVLTSAGLWESAYAATAVGSLGVTITIAKTCVVGTSTPVDFGLRTLLTSDIDADGALSVTCTTGTTYDIGLGAGTGSGASVASRLMTGPLSATVTYQLYRNPARSQNWGETVGTDTLAGTGSGLAQSIPVYGRVGSQTTPGPGTYNDTVTVTVTY